MATDLHTTIYPDPVSGEEKGAYSDLNGHWQVWLGDVIAVAFIV